MASAAGDGGWMVAWWPMAAWAPLLVFIAGLVVPRTWPGTHTVFTESTVFLAMAVGLSMLSGTLGIALLAAHIVREALSRDVASDFNAVVHTGAGQLVAWLLMAVLVVMLPQFARLVAEAGVVRLRFLKQTDIRALVRSFLLALIYVAAVLVWCAAVPILIQPVFTWSGQPPLESIGPLATSWRWLAAVAGGAAFARGVLEGIVAPRAYWSAEVERLTRERHAAMRDAGSAWKDVSPIVRGLAAAAGTTLLVAGLFVRLEDALAAGLVLTFLALVARRQRGWLTGAWSDLVRAIPGAGRVAIALILSYLLTDRLLASAWMGQSLRPVLTGMLLTIALLAVLFPAEDERLRPVRVRRVRVSS